MSKLIREAYLGNNEEEKLKNNRRVVIEVIGTLPILVGDYIDKLLVTDADIGVIDSVETATPAAADNYNVLVDINNDDRYLYLGSSKSLITKIMTHIYYDNKHTDILVMPDTVMMGSGDNDKLYVNNTMTLQAYNVSVTDIKNKPNGDIVCPVNIDIIDSIPLPNRFSKTTTVLASTFGLENNSMYNSNRSTVNGKTITLAGGLPTQYIIFEDNETIFDEVKALSVCNMTQQIHGTLNIDPVGKHKTARIVIPLNF